MGSVQFIAAMIAAQLAYPGYSDVRNAVSDLGHPLDSPLHAVFNVSLQLLGLIGLVATLLIRPAFASRSSARGGLLLLGIASLGAVATGTFPETSPELNGSVHALATLVTFAGAGLALVLLGIAMVRDTRWDGFRGFTALAGLASLAALVAYVAVFDTSAVAGAVERVIIAPLLLWGIIAGVHLARLPGYAPAAGRPTSEF